MKHDHDSHRENTYVVDNHILLCLCRMWYHNLCQLKIQFLCNLKLYFLLFFQDCMQQTDDHYFLIYWERDILQDLNGVFNLD